MRANLRNVVFQGSQIRLDMALADGSEMVCHLDHTEAGLALEPGHAFWVSWETDAGRLLPPQPEATPKSSASATTGGAARGGESAAHE